MNNKYVIVAALVLVTFLTGCGEQKTSQALPPGVTGVEIGYLNHAPVRKVLTQVDDLLKQYGDKVQVDRYDFNTPEGEVFAQDRDLTEHAPLAILIDGSMEAVIGDRTVKFYSFPQGEGTGVVPEGSWNIDDLRLALDAANGSKN